MLKRKPSFGNQLKALERKAVGHITISAFTPDKQPGFLYLGGHVTKELEFRLSSWKDGILFMDTTRLDAKFSLFGVTASGKFAILKRDDSYAAVRLWALEDLVESRKNSCSDILMRIADSCTEATANGVTAVPLPFPATDGSVAAFLQQIAINKQDP